VLGGDLDWRLIGVGAGIGVLVIFIDEMLGRAGKMRLPPLAVGMGIYLPMALTLLIPVGALIGHFYDKWANRTQNPAFAERMGVLAATGLIVGESLFGVIFAGIVGATGKDAPLAIVGANFETLALFAAPVVFAGAIWLLYGRTKQMAQ
jgi:putative OPT family oligopeptide transporter